MLVAAYDRLAVILKHDLKLEQEILEWNGDVLVDTWFLTSQLIKKKWQVRNPRYA